jgi:pyruvate kinase
MALEPKIDNAADAVSYSAAISAHSIDAKALITLTHTGTTARRISRFRPQITIIGATTSIKTFHKLSFNWGVMPIFAEQKDSTDELLAHAEELALQTKIVNHGDQIVIVAGIPAGGPGKTNSLKIHTV